MCPCIPKLISDHQIDGETPMPIVQKAVFSGKIMIQIFGDRKHSKAFKSIQKLKSLGTWINMTIHFIAILITKRYYLSVTIESIEASHAFEWDRGTDRHRIPWPVDLSLMLKIRILHAPWFVASCWEMFHLVKSRKNFNGIQWNVGHRHHGNAVYEKRTQNNRVWIVPALSEAWFHGEIIR